MQFTVLALSKARERVKTFREEIGVLYKGVSGEKLFLSADTFQNLGKEQQNV